MLAKTETERWLPRDALKDRTVGRVPFASEEACAAYCSIGNTAEGFERYTPERIDVPTPSFIDKWTVVIATMGRNGRE